MLFFFFVWWKKERERIKMVGMIVELLLFGV